MQAVARATGREPPASAPPAHVRDRTSHPPPPSWTELSLGAPRVQRKCACGTESAAGTPCAPCAEEERANLGAPLQRKPAPGGERPAAVAEDTRAVLRSSGSPLERDVRGWAETRLRRDLGDVRVHSDEQAARSASELNAVAYTAGSHVVFGRNRYQPATDDGRRLIAHELAHVAQQADAPAAAPEGVGPADHPSEHEADRVADAMTAGDASVPSLSTAPARGVARMTGGSVNCTSGTHGAPADALGILDATELLLLPAIVIAGADLGMLRLDIVLPGLGAGGGYALPANTRLTNYRNRFGLPPAAGGGRFRDRLGGGTYTTQAEALYHEADHLSDRFSRISDYASNTVIDYRCIGGPTKIGACTGHCSGRTATACQGDDRIMLCPHFWTGMGPGGRTSLLIHELAHLVFNVDHARNFSHADCYAAFASDAATAGWVGVPACRP